MKPRHGEPGVVVIIAVVAVQLIQRLAQKGQLVAQAVAPAVGAHDGHIGVMLIQVAAQAVGIRPVQVYRDCVRAGVVQKPDGRLGRIRQRDGLKHQPVHIRNAGVRILHLGLIGNQQ